MWSSWCEDSVVLSRYEQRLKSQYDALKRLVLRTLDPAILSPLVRRQARQLVQQYWNTDHTRTFNRFDTILEY